MTDVQEMRSTYVRAMLSFSVSRSLTTEKHSFMSYIQRDLFLGPVVRKVDSAIHRIVIFSTVVKMLVKL